MSSGLVRPEGLEPSANCLKGNYSTDWVTVSKNHTHIIKIWWMRKELNLRCPFGFAFTAQRHQPTVASHPQCKSNYTLFWKFVKSFKEEDLKNLLNLFLYFQDSILRYQKRIYEIRPLKPTSILLSAWGVSSFPLSFQRGFEPLIQGSAPDLPLVYGISYGTCGLGSYSSFPHTTGTRYLSSLKSVRRLVIVRVSYLLCGYYDIA